MNTMITWVYLSLCVLVQRRIFRRVPVPVTPQVGVLLLILS